MASCLTFLIAALMPSAASAGYVYTVFDPIGSAGSIGTQVRALNNAGATAGYYRDATTSHGFLRDAGGGITSIDPSDSLITIATALN